jgi:basic membrane lipoprotein Med (substrate-binding protein (PBP1-ABC) superfamily)
VRRVWKLAAGFATAAMLLTACASDDDGTDDTTTGTDGGEGASGEDVQVGMAFDVGGRGDRSFNDSAAAGLDRAGEELGISFQDLSPAPDGSNRDELLRELVEVKWEEMTEAVPAALTALMMPFTYSIANGLALGLTLFPLLMVAKGRWREVHPVMYGLFVVFLVYFIWLAE